MTTMKKTTKKPARKALRKSMTKAVLQPDDDSCGWATTKWVLQFFGALAVSDKKLREELNTDAKHGVRALVRLVLLPVPACMIDMLGRLTASLLFGGKSSVSPRKPAIYRIVVIAAHIVAIPLVVALAPAAFPYATAWEIALITATLFAPLAIAVADMRRAGTSRR